MIFFFGMQQSNVYGFCIECDASVSTDDGWQYCEQCWNVYNTINTYRCFTICAVYTLSGERLAIATSEEVCAERAGLWSLTGGDIIAPKILVVARIRKNRSGKRWSYGCSKPCANCKEALLMYNVVKIAYSLGCGDEFAWENVATFCPTIDTKCKVIVRL